MYGKITNTAQESKGKQEMCFGFVAFTSVYEK